ncbi:MAG: hypothetical protein N2Z21_04735 [Candidatus Sumerlaeaceae bacterium]|nr:hypothetical protein [Candidatus Sumerlaeaceae bacterium]
MPHVIFHGSAELKEAWSRFLPQLRNEAGWITKITDCLLAYHGRCMLYESTAVYHGVTHNFYVRVEQKDRQITVRIEPRTNVEKNDGVKWAVAMVAKSLRDTFPQGLVFEKSNLPEHMLAYLGEGA